MSTVILRDFEERDIDFVYKCKNNEQLNSMIVGDWHPFTYEEAVKWVHGCMGEHENFKFWAVCTNDEEQRIVGWVSIANIDKVKRSALHYGIIIADPDYIDGVSMFEAQFASIYYVFDVLDLDVLYAACLSGHKISPHMLTTLGYEKTGVRKDAVSKKGQLHDVNDYVLTRKRYEEYKEKDFYDTDALSERFVESLKKNRKK